MGANAPVVAAANRPRVRAPGLQPQDILLPRQLLKPCGGYGVNLVVHAVFCHWQWKLERGCIPDGMS